MSEENKTPETSLPKFDLPKTAAPTIKIPSANMPTGRVAPTFQRGSDVATVVEEKKESPALVFLDAICAVASVAFAVILFLEMK